MGDTLSSNDNILATKSNILPSSNWPSQYLRNIKLLVKLVYRKLIGHRLYERLEFRRHLGYWPDLNDPKTLNEKICARKFRDFPSAAMLCDKLAVRDFVASRVGSSFLTRLYYGGDCPESVEYPLLPSSFVVKGTHGSGPDLRALIFDKSALSQKAFVALGRSMLTRKFGKEVNEPWYSSIRPRILIEELIADSRGNIVDDFKFYVFNGVVGFIQVISDRHTMPKGCFYDAKWRPQPFTRAGLQGESHHARPAKLEDMIHAAETLADELEFARIDMYYTHNRIIFGEITLAPGAGWIAFKPSEYDLKLGRLW